MKQLIEDYKRRLATVDGILDTTKSNGSIYDISKLSRLTTQANEFRAFIADMERVEAARNTGYFKIIPGIDPDRIEVECGKNGRVFLIHTDEGMVVDVYANGVNDIIDTMAIWDEDLNNLTDFTDDLSEDEQPDSFEPPTAEEVGKFTREWGQKHVDICENLGYDIGTADDLLMVDYFWLPITKEWYPIISCVIIVDIKEIIMYI